MKKRIRIVSVSIVLVILLIGIIVINNNSSDKYSFTQDGIKYALTLDGEKTTSFPSKGMYQAQVTCVGADGRWLYDDWKLALENITGDISCDIDFSTITKTNLNDYIVNLSGTTQGTGEVVSEIASIPEYSSATTISQSAYTNQSVFSSTSSSSTSGTAVSGAYIFANNTWTSVPSAMTSGTYYHFKFNPSEGAYYQMCYSLTAGNTINKLKVYVNTVAKISSIEASPSTTISGCVNLGYIISSDYIKITQYEYTSITATFSIKKISTINSVAAGIRYEGKNPNNYVWFNNEYWRIIGVFDSASHGQSEKNLVKIIRENSLESLIWDKSTTDWTSASLNMLLNKIYYNAQNDVNLEYCYGCYRYGMTIVPTTCDYTKKGIQSGYRNMIANVTWYLGGSSSASATPEAFYGDERGTEVYRGNSTSTIGYIGLAYPSDYGYSVLSSSCARTTNLYSYNNATCAGASWLFRKSGWMLTSGSYNDYVHHLDNGGVTAGSTDYGYNVYPVLYLDSSVFLYDGDGSLENPYIIGM